jgi:outer membrane murein-binding lipoprotein Lpp
MEEEMRTTRRWAASLVAVFAVYAAACVNPQEVSDIKTKVDEMHAQQKDILTKLEAVSKSQQEILAKAPAARPAQPQEDPNKVYQIDVGDSYFKGPKDASIVMVEWSDFQ